MGQFRLCSAERINFATGSDNAHPMHTRMAGDDGGDSDAGAEGGVVDISGEGSSGFFLASFWRGPEEVRDLKLEALLLRKMDDLALVRKQHHARFLQQRIATTIFDRLLQQQREQSLLLCTTPTTYHDQYTTGGARDNFSCGYQCLMMLLSTVSTLGEAPPNSIETIQRFIERAWSQGYDTKGKATVGPLVGTEKKIGSPECWAVLAMFHMNPQVYTVPAAGHVPNMKRRKLKRTDSPTRAHEEHVALVKLFVVQHFTQAPGGASIHPLWFVHDDHVRVIVGVVGGDETGGGRRMIMFDPAVPKERVVGATSMYVDFDTIDASKPSEFVVVGANTPCASAKTLVPFLVVNTAK